MSNKSRIIIVDDIRILKKSVYPRVVNYTASWCGPCKKIAPSLDALSVKYPEIYFFKVDIDQHQDHVVDKKISSVPTFLFYKDILSEPEIVRGANEADIIKHLKKLQAPKY